MIYSVIDRLARQLLRRAFRRGLLEGSIPWLAAGAAALVVRLMFKPEQPRVQREKLAVGETLIVRHLPPPETSRRKSPSNRP